MQKGAGMIGQVIRAFGECGGAAAQTPCAGARGVARRESGGREHGSCVCARRWAAGRGARSRPRSCEHILGYSYVLRIDLTIDLDLNGDLAIERGGILEKVFAMSKPSQIDLYNKFNSLFF